MITLKTLKWDNLFSYGKGNVIEFDKYPIIQLIGKNGHGKSSIALVLEECLFNKNSKGIKKADILNRYVKDKSYSIELSFDKDGDEYVIKTTRGSTQTVSLYKNGENISSHTATSTFKQIEDIFGIDQKAFSQLVYQSSSASLEFLTATDTNRKKFLIDLLNLTRYVEAFEVFKTLAKEIGDEVVSIESSIKTTKSWLDKNIGIDLTELPIVVVPELDPTLEQSYHTASAKLKGIEDTNKQITKNNQYREHLDNIDISLILDPMPEVQDSSPLVSKRGEHTKVIKDADTFIAKVAKLAGTCPTCLQVVDRTKLEELIAEQETLKKDASSAIKLIDEKIAEISVIKKKVDTAKSIKSEYEQYHSLIDTSLESDLLDAEILETQIKELSEKIASIQVQIKSANDKNTKIAAHNSKVSVIKEQMDSMNSDLNKYSLQLGEVVEKLGYIQILQKTFSTSGLIAYKIECLIKDLEDLANEYLTELSDGRFQLTFKVTASDKLNVVITDNGRDIDILALSGGERARVNTATLLAIRRLMQSLSNARINLLILDETIDSLDVDGKEKLIEVLVNEEHLNTILVSHGYTHPLLEKITVIKENNVSRLE